MDPNESSQFHLAIWTLLRAFRDLHGDEEAQKFALYEAKEMTRMAERYGQQARIAEHHAHRVSP